MSKANRLDRVNLLLKAGFGLRSWEDNYSKGTWACIALRSELLEEVEDASSLGDLDMIPAMDYVFSVDWLPLVTGVDLESALQTLEERLAKLPEGELSRVSHWSFATTAALEHLQAVIAASNDYGDMYNAFNELSSDYKKIWK